MATEPQSQPFTVRPPGPAHDAFVLLNERARAADVRLNQLTRAYIEKHLGPELQHVVFGWEEACDGPQVLSYRTVDEWDLTPDGVSEAGGFAFDDGSFEDIEAAVSYLDDPWAAGIEELTGGVDPASFLIRSHPDGPNFFMDELEQAIADTAELRADTEVAAIAALRERVPLNVTTMHLGQCVQSMFCTFSFVSNGAGEHYDDDVMNELDPYAEAIRWKASDEALAAG